MRNQKVNKYPQVMDDELDLHGMIKSEAKDELQAFLEESESKNYKKIRIITGKGLHSKEGPVLKNFVQEYLSQNHYRYETSKINEGGEGAIVVSLK